MATETELKLQPARMRDLPRLLAHPRLAGTAPERLRLDACYFDTPELDLLRARMAVRERREGARRVWTVKTAGEALGGLSRRGEWEGPARRGGYDFAALLGDDAPELSAWLRARQAALQPVFRTRFTRLRWTVEALGARIEVALDRGQILCVTPEGTRREPLLELELERLEGPEDALFALALELNEAMPLWPLSASKAERGYALYLQTRGAAAAAAPRPTQPISSEVDRRIAPRTAPRTAPRSDPNRPARDAFVPLAQAALDALVPPLRTAALTPERGDAAAVEAVHQSRVALRRLRALLAAFAPALPGDWAARERSHWRTLAQALGRVRDLDVLRSEIGPQLMQAVPGSSASRWSAALAHEQARAWRRLQAELQQPATTAQVLQFARALHGLSAAGDGSAAHGRGHTLRALARQRLRHRQRRLRRALAAVLDTRARDAERVHALRIEVKKLRYATEALIDALPPKAEREAQRRLEVLISAQSALGRWHDWQLAAAWQGEVARRPTGADSALCAALQAELTRQRRRVRRACAALEAVI